MSARLEGQAGEVLDGWAAGWAGKQAIQEMSAIPLLAVWQNTRGQTFVWSVLEMLEAGT